jgi:hypothetical protein
MSWNPVDWGEAAWNAGSDMVNSALGNDTREQAADKAAIEKAKADGEQARAKLAGEQRGLHVGGTDPASINAHDNWEQWDHPRLDKFRDTLKIEDINRSGRAWQKLGEDIAEIFADLHSGAVKSVGEGMQGKGAEAALAAAKPMQDWGQKFGDSVRMTGLKIEEIGVAAEQTKASLQPPQDSGQHTARNVLGAVIGPGGMVADGALQMKEREEDAKRARAVMTNVYTPGYTSVDKSVPTLPPPVDPVNPPPPPPPPGGSNIPGSRNPGMSQSPHGQTPSNDTPSSPNSPGDSGRGRTPNMPNVPAGTDPSWATPQPGGPAGPGGMPGGPGGGPGGMGGGFVGGMPGGAGAGARGTGGGRAGGMGGSAAGRGGAGGGPGAGGRAGAGGMGGGAAGGGAAGGARGGAGAGAGGMGGGAGRGGEGGDDQEHERPSWLEEHDDIWMNDMPKTAPAVFGDWSNER